MNGISRAASAFAVLSLAFGSSAASAAGGLPVRRVKQRATIRPDAQVYAPLWRVRTIEGGPCVLTLMQPAKTGDGCTSWTRREAGGAAIDESAGQVVVGTSQGELQVRDLRTARLVRTVRLQGGMTATPTIDGGIAYVGTDDGAVAAVRLHDGKILWQVFVDGEVREPAAVSGGRVLVVSGLDTLHALDQATGRPLWQHREPLPPGITLRGQSQPAFGVARIDGVETPVVARGTASGHGFLLNATNGSVVQRVLVGKSDAFFDVDADPVLNGTTGYFASHATGVLAVDLETGRELWRLREPGLTRLGGGTGGVLVALGADAALGIDPSSGRVRWRVKLGTGAPSRPVIKGGRVHFTTDRGGLIVLDASSGRPLQRSGSGLGVAADVALTGDLMVSHSTAGLLTVWSNAWRGGVQAGSGERRAGPWSGLAPASRR